MKGNVMKHVFSFCLCAAVSMGMCAAFLSAQSDGITTKDQNVNETANVVHEATPDGADKIGDIKTLVTSEIVRVIQKEVDLLKENLVDIISSEEVSIEAYFDREGKPRTTTTIISEYRIFPEKNEGTIPNCRAAIEILADPQKLKTVLREERKVLSKKGGIESWLITAYLDRTDNFVDLLVAFDKQNENCFNYELLGVENNERKAFVIRIIGKEEYNIITDMENWKFRYEGNALFDYETMAIVQLNKLGIAYIPYNIWVSYGYDKVRIRDQFLTLPVFKAVESFSDRDRKKLDMRWTYRYSDYKAFGVDTKISFGPNDE